MNVYCYYQSPLGTMTLQANQQGLLGAWFATQTTQPDQLGNSDDQHPVLRQAVCQLEEYFAGQRQQFDLPLAASGTEFQKQVWRALTEIPYGETFSYQQLAEAIGNPKAVRAVGLANGKNPISIIVPCHRVIGKNGRLTGYAGGVERKAALLAIEQGEPVSAVNSSTEVS
ncbi:methylated-DNA--[protein]-cysteine S-methyltransferase [Vibrio sp.]|uniref:methylated-DNA--[protein]-cysteine S-methyltransferase n=1 Tax=Vibrio sp. TaxID=678 RepID=UPI003D0B9F2A